MIDTAIYAILSENQGVAQLVETRIYPNLVPQGEPVPAIWFVTDEVQPLRCASPGKAIEGFFEVGVISGDYDQVLATIKEVRAALDNYSGAAGGYGLKTFRGVEQPTGYDDTLKLHEKSIRFKVLGQIQTP